MPPFPAILSRCALAAFVCLAASAARAEPQTIVAAENFYGDVARQIGSSHFFTNSIMTNPDEDPHLFEASPSTARLIAHAKVVILNGAGYDPWMDKLLGASPSDKRVAIVVADLAGKRPGDNPHLWYDPGAMKRLGDRLAEALGTLEPSHKADFDKANAAFAASLAPLEQRIAQLRAKYQHTPVAASEPVFGYMADLIGLDVREQKFALAVMNNAEPAASDVGQFENDLRDFKVKALIYNAQASDPAVARLLAIAKSQGMPVVPVTETEPAGTTYQAWMMGELNALDKALGGAP